MARVALENSSALAWPDAMRHPDSYDSKLHEDLAKGGEWKCQVEESVGNRVSKSSEIPGAVDLPRGRSLLQVGLAD